MIVRRGIAKVLSWLRIKVSFICTGRGELEGEGRMGEREGGIGMGESDEVGETVEGVGGIGVTE